MALLAFALLAILLPQQARGPAGDDDGTGAVSRPLTKQRCPVPTGELRSSLVGVWKNDNTAASGSGAVRTAA